MAAAITAEAWDERVDMSANMRISRSPVPPDASWPIQTFIGVSERKQREQVRELYMSHLQNYDSTGDRQPSTRRQINRPKPGSETFPGAPMGLKLARLPRRIKNRGHP